MNKQSCNQSDCRRYHDLIQKRLDGEIGPEANRELDEHLAVCPHCLEELTSFATMKEALSGTMGNAAEVPEGFFEGLAVQLDEVEPARGWQAILAHPFFTTYRNIALAATSIVLVAVLTISVGAGAASRLLKHDMGAQDASDSRALILTNSGDKMVLPGDAGESGQYAAALDDLERAYREAQGQESGENAEGYIHTSWHDGESATPIR